MDSSTTNIVQPDKALGPRLVMMGTSRERHEPTVDKILYDRKSAALALSLSIRSIDYLIAQGVLRTRKVGHKVLIPASELRRFASANHYGVIQHLQKAS